MKNLKFVTCKDQAGKEISFPEGLYVVAFMDSLMESKSMRPLGCLWNWKEEFRSLSIPVYIISPRKMNFANDDIFQYFFDSTKRCFRDWGVLKEKNVFGKTYEVIYASMFVFDGTECVYQGKSISDATVGKMLIYLSKLWIKTFQKKVKKRFDNT